MPEINPSNEALTQLRPYWPQICVAVMRQHKIKEVTIDLPDLVGAFGRDGQRMPYLAVIGRKHLGPHGGFTLLLCDTREELLEAIAKHQGRG